MPSGQIGLIPTQFNPLEIGFLDGHIARITGSATTHCVIGLNDRECMSAERGGVRVRPLYEFPVIKWSHFSMSDGQRDEICTWAYSQLRGFWRCAPFCVWTLEEAGVEIFGNKPPSLIYPGVLEVIWKERGWWRGVKDVQGSPVPRG